MKKLLRYWASHSMMHVHVLFAVLASGIYFVSKMSDKKHDLAYLESWAILVFAIGVLHFLIHSFLYRQHKYLFDHQNVQSLPKERIRRFNFLFFLFFLACCVISVLLFSLLPISRMRDQTLYDLKVFFGLIIGFFISFGGTNTARYDYQNNAAKLAKNTMAKEAGLEATPLALIIIKGALIVLGLLLILYIIFRIVKEKFTAWRGEDALGGSRKIRGVDEISKRLDKDPLGKLSIFQRDPNSKIRRRFKQEILRGEKDKKRFFYFTAKELTQNEFGKNPSNREFHELYEKARYHEEGCDEQDWQRMREIRLQKEALE